MARIPDPTPGLIFRYGYLWLAISRRNRNSPTKDRPACIVMQVGSAVDPSLRTAGGSMIQARDVIILPITTRPPSIDVVAIELSPDEKRVCGLNPDGPSWVVVSEFNADTWPNADIVPISDTGQFRYGIAPPGLMRRISRAFAEARRTRRVIGVKR
jgi:hypothetical protein